MDIKNQEQALKLQEEFKSRLLQTVETLRKGKAPSLDAMLGDTEKLIARTQARLDSAIKEREAVLRQWDERIARLKEDVQRLQADTRDVKERVSKQESEPTDAERRKAPAKKKTSR
jgi:TolA-binding protein